MTLGNDNGTDGQTDRQTDRVRRNMRPPPREEGRIKSGQKRRKHCALAVVRRSKKISPRRRPPSRGLGTAKMLPGNDHYLYLQTQFGEDRCTQFRVIVVTAPQTHKHTQTNRQDRLRYTAPQLARSVIIFLSTLIILFSILLINC